LVFKNPINENHASVGLIKNRLQQRKTAEKEVADDKKSYEIWSVHYRKEVIIISGIPLVKPFG